MTTPAVLAVRVEVRAPAARTAAPYTSLPCQGRLAVCRRIVCGGESEGKRKGEEARSREGRAW